MQCLLSMHAKFYGCYWTVHPPPASSIHLQPPPPSSIHLHPVHFSLHLALCNTLNVIRTKMSHELGNFPKFRSKNLKLTILTENWHIWYIRGADSEPRHSEPKIRFWANLGRKNQTCLFCLKIGTNGISRILVLISTLVFWISNQKPIFGQIWAKKVEVVCFAWKLAHLVSRRCWFLF